MADNVDTLDFFGRLENRLALVATMTEAQGKRLDRLSPVEPVAGELCNELGALRVDVAAVVDEVRKLARHIMAVECVTIPAAALAQQMQADARSAARVVQDRRKGPAVTSVAATWPATWADGLAAADLSALPGLRDMAQDLHAGLIGEMSADRWNIARAQAWGLARQLGQVVAGQPARGASTVDNTPSGRLLREVMELRGQGRLVDAQELAGSDLLDMAELQAQALANLANAPALVSLDTLDEISARGAAMLGRLRQLVDTDARRRQLPAFDATGPVWPEVLAP